MKRRCQRVFRWKMKKMAEEKILNPNSEHTS